MNHKWQKSVKDEAFLAEEASVSFRLENLFSWDEDFLQFFSGIGKNKFFFDENVCCQTFSYSTRYNEKYRWQLLYYLNTKSCFATSLGGVKRKSCFHVDSEIQDNAGER